jgi:hypothetical protein
MGKVGPFAMVNIFVIVGTADYRIEDMLSKSVVILRQPESFVDMRWWISGKPDCKARL